MCERLLRIYNYNVWNRAFTDKLEEIEIRGWVSSTYTVNMLLVKPSKTSTAE